MDTESLNKRLLDSKCLLDELSKGLFTVSEYVFVCWITSPASPLLMDMHIRTESRELLAIAVQEYTFLADCAERITAAAEAANVVRERLLACTNLLHNDQNRAVSLPSELIATFFEHGLPDWPDDDPFELPQDDMEYLGGITLVCHSWREAALNSPRLWTRIKCTISWGPDSFKRVRRPLSLSGQLPLAIDIDQIWVPQRRDEGPAVHTPFALINPHAHRLQRMNLIISSHGYRAIIQLFSGNLPLLSHMSLTIHSDFSTENDRPLPPISPSESLKYVRLTYEDGSTPIAKHSSVLALNAVFLQIALGGGPRRHLLNILRNAPAVEELVIQWPDGYDRTDSEDEEDKVTLSRLRLLIFSSVCYTNPLLWIERPAEEMFLQVLWGDPTMVPSEHVGTFALEEPYEY